MTKPRKSRGGGRKESARRGALVDHAGGKGPRMGSSKAHAAETSRTQPPQWQVTEAELAEKGIEHPGTD